MRFGDTTIKLVPFRAWPRLILWYALNVMEFIFPIIGVYGLHRLIHPWIIAHIH